MYYKKHINPSSTPLLDMASAINYGCIIFIACQIIVLPLTRIHEVIAIFIFILSGVVSSFLAARIKKSDVLMTGIILGIIYGPIWNILYIVYVKNQYLISLLLGTTNSDLIFTRMWQSYTATSIAILIASISGCIIYLLLKEEE